jgi:hypothetical protein
MIWEITVIISLIIVPIIFITSIIPHAIWGSLCCRYCKRLHTDECGYPFYD